MRATMTVKDAKRIAGIMRRAVAANANAPVAHVRVQNKPNRLFFELYRKDVYLRLTAPAERQEAGDAGLDWYTFNKACQYAKGRDLRLFGNEGGFVMTSDRGPAYVMRSTVYEHPYLEPSAPSFNIEGPALRTMLEQVRAGVHTGPRRDTLKSVYLETVDRELRATATNGFLLATTSATIESGDPVDTTFIMPVRMVDTLLYLLKDYERGLTVITGREAWRFVGYGFAFEVAGLPGRYPDYHSVLLRGWEKAVSRIGITKAEFNRLYDAVKAEDGNSEYIWVRPVDGILEVTPFDKTAWRRGVRVEGGKVFDTALFLAVLDMVKSMRLGIFTLVWTVWADDALEPIIITDGRLDAALMPKAPRWI